MNRPTPEQKQKMLKKILDHHSRLIDRGFSGTVQQRYDQGFLQKESSLHETVKLEDAS